MNHANVGSSWFEKHVVRSDRTLLRKKLHTKLYVTNVSRIICGKEWYVSDLTSYSSDPNKKLTNEFLLFIYTYRWGDELFVRFMRAEMISTTSVHCLARLVWQFI